MSLFGRKLSTKGIIVGSFTVSMLVSIIVSWLMLSNMIFGTMVNDVSLPLLVVEMGKGVLGVKDPPSPTDGSDLLSDKIVEMGKGVLGVNITGVK